MKHIRGVVVACPPALFTALRQTLEKFRSSPEPPCSVFHRERSSEMGTLWLNGCFVCRRMQGMRRGLTHGLAVIALLMIFGGHVTDPFNWDHTYQTGNEVDYAMVIVAAIGASVFLAKAAVRAIARFTRRLFDQPAASVDVSWLDVFLLLRYPTASPPTPLRI
jgi:hypothetical protein